MPPLVEPAAPRLGLGLFCIVLQAGPLHRSEGFPERDIWFLGTLEQGSARCPEFLGNRRRRRRLPAGGADPPRRPARNS